ncbi:thioredoxin domain-containing protein 17-like [Pollicipes pollicipes]|uniref:thioredoxin domain-containing protein 17-like n=1 Tax=Pollicipes pollicipes TaxID=41117 RepID=UPI001884AB24|nr:thioredoxin domain-containing protein 17-like [Pollicipes pollicipes]
MAYSTAHQEHHEQHRQDTTGPNAHATPAMVQRRRAEGFAQFEQLHAELSGAGCDVFMLFSGAEDPATGHSWCPDCVAAEPVVEKALAAAPDDAVFVHVSVGSRDFWKDPACVFRTDPRTRLKSVPTLLKLGSPERLQENQLLDASLVEMLFSD